MVERGNKLIKKFDPYYIHFNNQYASLPAFSVTPDLIENKSSEPKIKIPVCHQSHYQLKVERRCQQQYTGLLAVDWTYFVVSKVKITRGQTFPPACPPKVTLQRFFEDVCKAVGKG